MELSLKIFFTVFVLLTFSCSSDIEKKPESWMKNLTPAVADSVFLNTKQDAVYLLVPADTLYNPQNDSIVAFAENYRDSIHFYSVILNYKNKRKSPFPVNVIPSLITTKNGKIVKKFNGYPKKRELVKIIDTNF